MTHLQPFDPVIVHGRPAVFLWYYWAGRHYGRIRFTDTNERAVVNVTDIHKPPDISETAQKCVDAVRDVFATLDARLVAIDEWDPLDSDEPALAATNPKPGA